MNYSSKPTPKPADPKRSPQRAALELAKKKAAQRKEMADFQSGKYDLSVKDVKSGKGGKNWTEAYGKKK
jgi:hypothetical protein